MGEKQDQFLDRMHTKIVDRYDQYLNMSNHYGDGGKVVAAILALAEKVEIGLARLDKPRWVYPSDYQNNPQKGKLIDK